MIFGNFTSKTAAAAGLLSTLLLANGCGKDYNDPRVFTESKIQELAETSSNNWFPKGKKTKLKFTLTDLSKGGGMGEEHIRFKGKVVLPENCFVSLNIADELKIDKKEFETRNAFLRLHEQKKCMLVQEIKAGEVLDANGFYKRVKETPDDRSEWQITYAEFHPAGNLTLEQKYRETYRDCRILKKGTAEFSQYLSELKAEYENEAKKAAERKQQTEKIQQELSRVSGEQNELLQKIGNLESRYQRNNSRLTTLNRQVARETRNLNSKRAIQARNARAKLDQANQEIKTLTEQNARIKEEYTVLKKSAAEKKEKIAALKNQLQEVQKK